MQKLDELLELPTTIVLGAGASKDYGFPLWGDLKSEFLTFVSEDENWKSLLEEYADRSIDKIVSHADNSQLIQFQSFITENFHYLEAELLSNNLDISKRWLKTFAQKFFYDLESNAKFAAKRFKNLNIINLNYDRVFEYEFQQEANKFNMKAISNDIRSDAYFRDTNIEKANLKLNVVHPHGCLGRLNADYINQYGPGTKLNNQIEQKGFHWTNEKREISRSILPIELVKFGQKTPNYDMAINFLKNSLNLIAIGVSKMGWNDSRLYVPNNISQCICTGEKIAPEFLVAGKTASTFVNKL